MNRPMRTAFTAAAGLALALVALPARADHDRAYDRVYDRGYDRGYDRDHDRYDAPAAVPPVAYPAPFAYRPVAPAPVVVAPYRHAHWRGGWQLRELRREYGRLDFARDRFYATWDGRPWSRNRFEAWYGSRRADLDQRWAELERY